MLERYFVRPETVDRIRASWIGPQIERYVEALAGQGYAQRTVLRRVPLLVSFGEFARARGVAAPGDLPAHLDAFLGEWLARRRPLSTSQTCASQLAKEARGPIEGMLAVVLPGFAGSGRPHRADPFIAVLPGLFDYLTCERGLRPATLVHYRHHLHRFEDYLQRVGLRSLAELSPTLVSAFIAQRHASGMARSTIRDACGTLRVLLRYAHREGLLAHDLSTTVEWPQVYRLSAVPRSISWADVGKLLDAVERRTPAGRRDYAILLLLITYGLRSREVAALRLDDIDWRRERLVVPERKAGHASAYPLSASVGAALADYLRHGRPASEDRQLFLRAQAPLRPIGAAAVSARATHYLRKAGIEVARPGSHTLRHTCVQRLVDAELSLKTIGDFVGHRSPASTGIYAKVAVESLRQLALGDIEEVLR